MNIAVFHNLPSGGALKALYDKIIAFESKGYSVSLYTFTTSEQNFLPVPKISGTYHNEPLNFKGLFRIAHYLHASRRVAKLINALKVDVVYVDKCRFFGSPPILRFLNKKCYFYCHEPLGLREYLLRAKNNDSSMKELTDTYRALSLRDKCKKIINFPFRFLIKQEDQRSIKAAGYILTCSNFSANWLSKIYGLNPIVLYQGIDVEHFKPDANIKKGNYTLSVGRLEKRKGHEFILESLGLVNENLRPELCIVYDEENALFKKQLELRSKKLCVKVHFYYRPTHKQLLNLYQTSKLVLCAGVNEPFGLVPLEAMACECPVIAVNEGGYTETVLDNVTGFLRPRDVKKWAETIEICINNEKMCRMIGCAGNEYVQKNWHKNIFVNKFETLIQKHHNG